jgi:hypothetical protein
MSAAVELRCWRACARRRRSTSIGVLAGGVVFGVEELADRTEHARLTSAVATRCSLSHRDQLSTRAARDEPSLMLGHLTFPFARSPTSFRTRALRTKPSQSRAQPGPE